MNRKIREWAHKPQELLKLGFCMLLGACVPSQAQLAVAVGQGAGRVEGTNWSGPVWVGSAVGYWSPQEIQVGASIGGIYEALVEPDVPAQRNAVQGSRGGLCPGVSGDLHLANGSLVGTPTQNTKRRALLRVRCNPEQIY